MTEQIVKEMKEDVIELRQMAGGKLCFTLKVRMLQGGKEENQIEFITRVKNLKEKIEKELDVTKGPTDIGR